MAPRSPRPPADACSRGKRRAEAGARLERVGRREGRRERRSGSGRRPAGSRLGLNTPGAVSFLSSAPNAGRQEPGTYGAPLRSCASVRPRPFHAVTKSGGFLSEKAPLLK